MTKAQWKALYDYCDENGISKYNLLKDLKEHGSVDRRASLEDLGDYAEGLDYDGMKQWLENEL